METGSKRTGNKKHEFNIRVYGICTSNGKVLLSDEIFHGVKMTKFPGGGLEYGEGTIDCLKREIREELGREIIVKGHFYTTDYFQPAMFFENSQLISIYYLIDIVEMPFFPENERASEVNETNPRALRWVDTNRLDESHLTFPVDKKVAMMLRQGV